MASKNSIGYQTRLFVLISCFTWILTFAFFVLQYAREREYKIESLNSKLQILNTETLHMLREKESLSKEILQVIAKEDSLRVTVIDFKGNVLFDTGKDQVQENHKDRKEFTDAMKKGTGYTLRRVSHMDSKEYFYSATKGDSIVVRTAVPYNNSMIQMLSVDWVYGVIIIMMALVVNVIAYFATRRIGKTIRSLRDFSTQAEAGTLDSTSVTVSFPDDELGEISSHIVSMYVKQQGVMRERDESLKAVLHEEQEKVRIKHQLTNNINHEIKTPVHAIQACLETIITNKEKLSSETTSGLLEKAYEHVKRLSSLLHDISMITRMTEASSQITVDDVDVKSIIEDVKSDMTLYAPEKRMRINVEMPETVQIKGNRGLLESIFRNLVDNSIAYSGGRDIFITVKDANDYYEFEFADNGIGISDEHIERIFERFYRVDEGRSRKLGGTGLGLSIVKNAVQFHKGIIKVENRKTGGLQYTFTLHK